MEQRQALKCCKITFHTLLAGSSEGTKLQLRSGRFYVSIGALWFNSIPCSLAARCCCASSHPGLSIPIVPRTMHHIQYLILLFGSMKCLTLWWVCEHGIDSSDEKKIEKNLADHEKESWLSCCITFGERNCFTTWLGSARGYAYLASIIEHVSRSSNPFHYLNGLFKNRLCHNLNLHNTFFFRPGN